MVLYKEMYPIQDVKLYEHLLPLCGKPTGIMDETLTKEFHYFGQMYLDLYIRYHDFYIDEEGQKWFNVATIKYGPRSRSSLYVNTGDYSKHMIKKEE